MKKRNEKGIAIFMVLSTLAILSIVISELVYSTHMQQRLAYNYTDGLKAYYTAKAGYKIALLRLRAYSQVQSFLSGQAGQAAAGMIDQSVVEKIWSFPFVFPIPVTPEATLSQKDAIKEFNTKSELGGSFQMQITSGSSKLNLNNLLVTTAPAPTPSPSPSSNSPATPTPTPSPSPSGAPSEVNFRPLVEDTINSLLARKKESDREFGEAYRNTTGKDLVDAIMFYMKQDPANPIRPNLPDAEKTIPKNAPLYSLTELHFIHGFDDAFYDLISPTFTVLSTPGINVNTASKATIWSLLPQLTEEEINDFMKKRDDPTDGKLFASEDKFWDAVSHTSLASRVNSIKENLQKAGLKIMTSEKSFHIQVTGMVGLSNRTIEASVLLAPPQNGAANLSQGQQPPRNPTPPAGAAPQNSSGNSQERLQLIYWRMH